MWAAVRASIYLPLTVHIYIPYCLARSVGSCCAPAAICFIIFSLLWKSQQFKRNFPLNWSPPMSSLRLWYVGRRSILNSKIYITFQHLMTWKRAMPRWNNPDTHTASTLSVLPRGGTVRWFYSSFLRCFTALKGSRNIAATEEEEEKFFSFLACACAKHQFIYLHVNLILPFSGFVCFLLVLFFLSVFNRISLPLLFESVFGFGSIII